MRLTGCFDTATDSFQLRLRLSRCDAGLKARNRIRNHPPLLRVALSLRRIKRQRNPHVERMNKTKIQRQHTDHGVALVIERNGTSDDLPISAEAALPQTMTDDRRRRSAGPIFLRKKIASLQFHTQQREELRGDAIRVQSFWLARARQCQVVGLIRGEPGERLTLLSPREKMRDGNNHYCRLRIELRQPYQSVRVRIWQRFQ